MRELVAAATGQRLRWLSSRSAPDEFERLCAERGMPASAYPDAKRLRQLQAVCPRIILGIYSAGDDLLGAAVLLPLRKSTARSLDGDDFARGERLQPKHLRARWRRGSRGTDLYVSALVAGHGSGPSVLRAAATTLPKLIGQRSAYARVATDDGRRAAHYMRLQPHGSKGLWRRSPLEPHSSYTSAPRRLARYDNAQIMVSSFLRVARPTLVLLYGLLLVLTLLALLMPLGELSTFFSGMLSFPTSSIAPVMGTAATAGGLALTVFFFTAQSRLSGIKQYGVTAIYRIRDLVPLVLLTIVTVGTGTGFILTRGTGASSNPIALVFAGISVLSQLALLMYILLLSLGLIRGMDPVAIARQFAREIRGQDAEEWGLVAVSHISEGIRVDLTQRRVNFGLRDPVMPIHELILASNPQRYGQLLAVLAERIAGEYGCTWVQQFPDSGDWGVTNRDQGLKVRNFRHWVQSRGRSASGLQRERLQLTMLLLHYFRRIHRNVSLKIQTDYRRQAAQFVLSRLITVLARTRPLPGVERAETALVLTLCIDALLRVGADYSPEGVFAKSRPEVPNELLRAFVTAIDALDANDFIGVAEDAAQALNWLFNSRAVDRSRILSSSSDNPLPTLASKRLTRIVTHVGEPVLPGFVAYSPWEGTVPDHRVREEATDYARSQRTTDCPIRPKVSPLRRRASRKR